MPQPTTHNERLQIDANQMCIWGFFGVLAACTVFFHNASDKHTHKHINKQKTGQKKKTLKGGGRELEIITAFL